MIVPGFCCLSLFDNFAHFFVHFFLVAFYSLENKLFLASPRLSIYLDEDVDLQSFRGLAWQILHPYQWLKALRSYDQGQPITAKPGLAVHLIW